MSTIEQSIAIQAPLTMVYNRWTQFEEFPRFMDGVEHVEQRGGAWRGEVERPGWARHSSRATA